MEGNSQVLAVVVNPDDVQNNNYQTLVFIQQLPGTATPAAVTESLKTQIQAVGGKVQSETDRTINGVPAKDLMYSISTTSGVVKTERFIALQDKNKFYAIVCSAPTDDFDKQQPNFNVVIDSFKVL